MNFKEFRNTLAEHFQEMTKDATHLFEVAVDKDKMWNLYLDSYPEGTNNIYRVRREYDCSCCRHFIKNIGNVVVIKDGNIETVWDLNLGDNEFQTVANAMASYIRGCPVSGVFVTADRKFGTHHNSEIIDGGTVIEYDHFYLELPDKFVNHSRATVGTARGKLNSGYEVFNRALREITMESIDDILELIASNSLYRGRDYKALIEQFKCYKADFDQIPDDAKKTLYALENSVKAGDALCHIRNTAIGTLLVSLSEGKDINEAIAEYTKIVDPYNYKRPKAVFTARMLESAKKDIEEMGFMDSLYRRFANLDDITVNNILFANRDATQRIESNDPFAAMAKKVAVSPKRYSSVEEMSAEDFIKNVLPTAAELELLLENKHTPNFVSLIAPAKADAKTMFKWGNNFSWAYKGNITDSDISQRVVNAGGRVDGVLRFSQSWNYPGMRNASLMDTHVFLPGATKPHTNVGDKVIDDNYGNNQRVGWNHREHHVTGGVQDVDYTTAAPEGYIPVENITFPSMDRLPDGEYIFRIHNWRLRAPTQGGFKAELAFGGNVYKFCYKKPLANKEWVTVARLEKKNGEFRVIEMMENDQTPMNMWGVQTNQFIPVSVVCYSPNYWDENSGVGSQHLFFMLKGCVNPEQPNGFFNEFLTEELTAHNRRVFEALGAQMKVEDVEDQLSGVGFCMTKRAEVIVKVKSNIERIVKVKF